MKRLAASISLLSVFCTAAVLGFSETIYVRNGDFNGRGGSPNPEQVAQFRKLGLTCPDAAEWPTYHGYFGAGGTFAFPSTGGVNADSFARITGPEAWLTSYHGLALEGDQVYSVWARGKGKLIMHVLSYGKDENGVPYQLTAVGEGVAPVTFAVDSPKWVRYRRLIKKTGKLSSVHPWLNAHEGTVDVDTINIAPSTPALDLIVAEEEKLHGTDALIEDLELVKADQVFAERSAAYREAAGAFRRMKNGLADKKLAEFMETELAAMEPYVTSQGLSTIQTIYYNEMIAATRVLSRLAGKDPGEPVVIKATEAGSAKIVEGYKPGVRTARTDTVTIAAIETNKILYEEGENATVKCVIVNTAASARSGTLVAFEYADLDTAREIARGPVSIGPGATHVWTFTYNVGPESYGRAVEVRFITDAGAELDRWQEYCQTAREWFRVQMHSGSRYNNMGHFFASEPTDWGVHPIDVEAWKSAQAGYWVNPTARLGQVRFWHNRGVKFTFYQNGSFCGIMGYEEIRKHPEYVLYDPNGQFAVDPVSGGYPNPMELASPIEIGPKRKPVKPYLNRSYTPWQHAGANLAYEDAVEYGARCIRDYAKQYELDGIYIDSVITAMKGFGYDGKVNIPADREAVARLNARIQNLYCRVLKQEDPYFGTWYNFSSLGIEWMRSAFGSDAVTGSGFSAGESDAWIRAMNSWKNDACLMERTGALGSGDDPDRQPKGFLGSLCQNRDYTVQKYGGNTAIGYFQGGPIEALSSDRSPGLNKWGWPTINYFMSLITATQHHVIMCVTQSPSMEPSYQFQTRYSSLLWAPDIKLVSAAEKIVTVKTSEAVFWKQLVYRRATKDGYDLIVHLVRIPPTPLFDLDWVDEPAPLDGVRVTADIGKGSVTAAYACRPYQFEEPQQVIQQVLQSKQAAGKATVTVPPFRYHTMVVLRVETKK